MVNMMFIKKSCYLCFNLPALKNFINGKGFILMKSFHFSLNGCIGMVNLKCAVFWPIVYNAIHFTVHASYRHICRYQKQLA